MTKTGMGVGVFGIALAAVCLAWGIQAQENTTGQGDFRLTIGSTGISCYQVTKGTTNFTTPCVQIEPPKETVVAFTSIAILTTISSDGKDPCYVKHNGVTYEVPCK